MLPEQLRDFIANRQVALRAQVRRTLMRFVIVDTVVVAAVRDVTLTRLERVVKYNKASGTIRPIKSRMRYRVKDSPGTESPTKAA